MIHAPHIHANLVMHACDCMLFVFLGVMYLQTVGTRVPVHDGAAVQAAEWTPPPITPLCAIPGCPQYLKTESINRGWGRKR